MKIKYCSNCILPNTRPNIKIGKSGVCNACESSEKKQKVIDWSKRENDFKNLVDDTKGQSSKYDCIIPVSGGKDSTWQVLKALEYDMKPLCVTWKTPARNSLGQKNLDNLIGLGVDHIDFTINPKVEKLFTYKAFQRFGIPLIPMHMALHALPLQVAINYKVPLIIWGENSAFEYGGSDENLKGFKLDHAWLKKFGVTNGTISKDWISEDLTEHELAPYYWPTDKEQEQSGVRAVFLGHFFEWDPLKTFKIAKESGFTEGDLPKTGFYNFADIDDSFLITIHHWMKWYKFGFTRLWDNLSIEIRNNRITRKHAIEIITDQGKEDPESEINQFCKYLNISKSNFYTIANNFRNKEIWSKNINDIWQINSFIIKDWKWD
jgi:N-acetyl sugar amidotransferase